MRNISPYLPASPRISPYLARGRPPPRPDVGVAHRRLIPSDTYEGGFYRAVLATHRRRYEAARGWVDRARSALHPELRAIASDT